MFFFFFFFIILQVEMSKHVGFPIDATSAGSIQVTIVYLYVKKFLEVQNSSVIFQYNRIIYLIKQGNCKCINLFDSCVTIESW